MMTKSCIGKIKTSLVLICKEKNGKKSSGEARKEKSYKLNIEPSGTALVSNTPTAELQRSCFGLAFLVQEHKLHTEN